MDKYQVLKDIFEIENISKKISCCPKITENQLLLVLSKESYNLKDALNISAGTVTRYLTKLFPDKPKTTGKLCNWLLRKYGYKQCKHCLEVFEEDKFYANKAYNDGLSSYCKKCQYTFEKVSSVNRTAKYTAAKLERIPIWITEEDLVEIAKFYSLCPEGYHVDHIIPLQGEFVSGLHVLSNLQYLPAKENMSKGNRYTPL